MNTEHQPRKSCGVFLLHFSLAAGLLFGALGASSLTTSVLAQSPNANEIIHRSEQELRGRTEQGKVSMTVRTPDWQRTLQMDVLGRQSR